MVNLHPVSLNRLSFIVDQQNFVTCPQSIWSYSIVVRMANLQPVSLNRLSFIVDQQNFVTCPQSIWSYSIVLRMANLHPVSLNRLSFIVDQPNFDGVHDQSGVFHRGENGESPPCLSQSSLFNCRSTEFRWCPRSIWSIPSW